MAMKILFITSTYLGDAIISSGILNENIKKYPKAKFTVVSGNAPAPLFKNFPQVEKVIPLAKKKFSMHWIDLWFRCFLTKWDIIIDVRGTGISYFLYTKKRYIWQSKNTQKMKVHQLAEWMGLKATPENKIWVGKEDLSKAKELIGTSKVICISPAANWDKKCWPLNYFSELCADLTSKKGLFPGYKIAVFGAPNQRQELQPLFDQLPEAEDFVGRITLPTIAAYFSLSELFIGNDSGLMHLAASMETKTLGLFGPSPENIYGPWGKNAIFVRTPEDFFESMDKARNGLEVMKSLKVSAVKKAIEKLIS